MPSSSPTGTITLPAGYPQATITTTVGNVSTSSVDNLVRSPFKTFFTAGGTAGTSSPHLSLSGGQTSSQTPNVITITFDRAIPANHLGMNLGDVDVETVVIEMAQNIDGTLSPLTPAQMGFQETYNSTTSGTDVPVKTSDDAANTITLTGTGGDTNGASAWFIPETSVTQITLTSQITSFGRFYLWFAAIRPEPVVEWVPEVTEFELTEFPFTVTPPAPPPPPSGEAYTFTKDDTSTSDCTVDEDTSTLVVPKPGTCVVGASTPETDVFAAYTVTTTFTFTGATLAATGAHPVPLWALVVAATGLIMLVISRQVSQKNS